jgi:MFS family permease
LYGIGRFLPCAAARAARLTKPQDNTIIATAIPRITDQFHAINDVGWYGAAYLLATCALQLIYGKLYTFYSIKWIYLVAIFLFEVGSLVCGVTPNSLGLILGRAVAGIGAAGVFSGALLIINRSIPPRQRPMYMGLIGAMYGIASVAGPL